MRFIGNKTKLLEFIKAPLEARRIKRGVFFEAETKEKEQLKIKKRCFYTV